MSDFVQRANYVRAIQGELARTIQQIEGVETSRVMIVLPENRLVIDAQRKATASVFLNVRVPGLLTQEAVSAIRFLVSNAVEGLQVRDVTVVDNHGNVLFDPAEDVAPDAFNVPTRARTLSQYLLGPLMDEISGAFREK